jgi:hypothetical protein
MERVIGLNCVLEFLIQLPRISVHIRRDTTSHLGASESTTTAITDHHDHGCMNQFSVFFADFVKPGFVVEEEKS